MKNKNLTIIVPALNEEKNLNKVVRELISIADQFLSQYEILIYDDGSTDKTLEIAKNLGVEFKNVKVYANKVPLELARIFKLGIKNAAYENIILIPGDGAFENLSLINVFKSIGLKDMILTSRVNQSITRSKLRYLLAKIFFIFNKNIFNLKVKDINSIAVFPTNELKKINIIYFNKGFNLEFLVKLTRKKLSYMIVDVRLNHEKHVVGKSLNIYFILDVVILMFYLTFIKRH